MKVAKVVGQVTATAKERTLTGFKLLLVGDFVSTSEADGTGAPYVAVDLVGAGESDVVIVAEGSAARVADRTQMVPVDRAVVGIVDSLTVSGETTYTTSA